MSFGLVSEEMQKVGKILVISNDELIAQFEICHEGKYQATDLVLDKFWLGNRRKTTAPN